MIADTCGILTPTGTCGVEGEFLPTCRNCEGPVCPAHVGPGSLKEDHFDREGDGDHGPEAAMRETVLCTVCATEEVELDAVVDELNGSPRELKAHAVKVGGRR